MTEEFRLGEIERRIWRLERIVSALVAKVPVATNDEASRAAPEVTRRSEGVRIVTGFEAEAVAKSFVPPTAAELRALFATAVKIAGYKWDIEDTSLFQRFERGFRYVASLRRTDQIDYEHDAAWWAEEAEFSLGTGIIGGSVLIAAALAHGDVKIAHYDAATRAPLLRDIKWVGGPGGAGNTGFYLSKWAGRRATDAWKRLLSTEEISATRAS